MDTRNIARNLVDEEREGSRHRSIGLLGKCTIELWSHKCESIVRLASEIVMPGCSLTVYVVKTGYDDN